METASVESIEEKIEKALKFISHPAKIATLIVLDKSIQKELAVTDLTKKLKEIIKDHYSLKEGGISKFCADLISQGLLEERQQQERHRVIGLKETDEFSLALPYFVLGKMTGLQYPLEEVIGKPGNRLGDSSSYQNRMKYFVSFYLTKEYPSSSLSSVPFERTRKEIENLAGISPDSIKKQERKFKKMGLIKVEKGKSNWRYKMTKELPNFNPRKKETRESIKRLLDDHNNFGKDKVVAYDDFKKALGKRPSGMLGLLKKYGFVDSYKEDANKISLTEEGKRVAERVFLPIYQAIVGGRQYEILRSRTELSADAVGLLKEYFLKRLKR